MKYTVYFDTTIRTIRGDRKVIEEAFFFEGDEMPEDGSLHLHHEGYGRFKEYKYTKRGEGVYKATPTGNWKNKEDLI